MKIEFKKLKDVDLKKVFPVIQESEYKLIEDITLVIPETEYKKINSTGFLTLGSFQISKDLIVIAKGEAKNAVKAKVIAKIAEKNVYFDEVCEAVFAGVELQKNVLLYGKGGHNKSEGVLQILDEMKKEGIVTSEPFVMSFGDGLTEESLLGGINIKKFTDTGELEYLFKNSFLEHEVVIIEEIFDGPPQVLLALKDILTSKWARKGNQQHPMKTKVIIALTNKSKEDFNEDDSLEALTQRFAITSKVEWPSYTKKDWRMLFDKVLGTEFVAKNKFKLSELVEILDQNHLAQKSFCSPRTAIHAAQLYAYGGDLKLISDIDKDILAKFYRENKDREADEKDQKIFDLVDLYIKDNNLQDNDIVSDLLALVINEHKARTQEDIVFDEDTENTRMTKASKLDFAAAVLSLHGFSAKNNKLATDKIKFYRDEANKFKNKK